MSCTVTASPRTRSRAQAGQLRARTRPFAGGPLEPSLLARSPQLFRLDTQLLTTVLELPAVFSAVTGCAGV